MKSSKFKKKKYKVLILDLDGTTVPSGIDGLPSKKVIDAIHKAHNKLRVSVASGRPYYLAKNILNSLNIDGPCVLDGGAQVMNISTGEIIFEKFLSIEKQKEILKFTLPYHYAIYKSQGRNDLMKSLDDANQKTGKLVVAGVTPKDTIKILEELTAVERIACHPVGYSWVNSDFIDIHITDSESTKRHGIEELLKVLKVNKEDVIGVGDNLNDMPLFESVGFKIAMGSAPKELKDQADYVTLSIEEDGVADVINKFIL